MKQNYIFLGVMVFLLSSCSQPNAVQEQPSLGVQSSLHVDSTDVFAGINLTVSEGKRLIAKGFCAMPEVQNCIKNGMLIITRGTTNTYIAEELVGLDAPHGAFLTGHFVPEGKKSLHQDVSRLNEIVLKKGQRVDMAYEDALKELGKGDIILKGGNLLNYARRQAAVCIGAADGGTTYRLLPYVGEGKAHLIIPIGLEKETSADLEEYEKVLGENHEKLNFVPKLHLFRTGTVFTEIEALKQLADVEVFPYGVGGVAGREGGVSLVVAGTSDQVQKVLELVRTIRGERPFAE